MSITKNFIVLTDIHGNKENFSLISKELSSADLIILCGDITHFGKKEAVYEVLNELEKHNRNFVGVIGNCDYPEVEKCLIAKCCNVAPGAINRYGINFIGLSGSLTTPSNTPNEHSEEYYENKSLLISSELNNNEQKKVILISHQPPFGTLNDKLPNGTHAGSRKIRKFIEDLQPLICFTGHIHEGIGIDYVGQTTVVNPGAFKSGYYASVEIDTTSFNFNIQLKQIV